MGPYLGVGDDPQDDFQSPGFGHGRDGDSIHLHQVVEDGGGRQQVLVALGHIRIIFQAQENPAHLGLVGELGEAIFRATG